MDIFIYDLDENLIDRFINQDTDQYGHITRKATDLDHTIDMVINIKTIAVDENNIVIEYPNGNGVAIKCPSSHYHKIEVL